MKKFVVLLAVVLLAGATAAQAAPFNPINTRPVTINPPAAGEQSLQYCLDQIYGTGNISAVNDQQNAGMWGVIGQSLIAPKLRFEFAGNANTNTFGIWSGTDSTALTSYELFGGPAAANAFAVVNWVTPDSGLIYTSWNNASTPFSNLSSYGFGFYLAGPGSASGLDGRFYTVDELNPRNTAMAVAYREPNANLWALAFEDGGGDFDYNDMIISIESLVPVPEPGSMLLLGTGLFGLAGAVRRRMKK